MVKRGRPRKYAWLTLRQLTNKYTPHAQYLKWASANNTLLQTISVVGCPKCQRKDIELRHDKKHRNIRIHCIRCGHETSYRIKTPKPSSYKIIPIIRNGIQLGQKIVDHYHPATNRQRSDAIIIRVSKNIEAGRTTLGGEWYINRTTTGLHDQKRYYVNFEEVGIICDWNKMQAEHEKRLRQLEKETEI